MVDCSDLSPAGTRRDFLQRAGAMGLGALLPAQPSRHRRRRATSPRWTRRRWPKRSARAGSTRSRCWTPPSPGRKRCCPTSTASAKLYDRARKRALATKRFAAPFAGVPFLMKDEEDLARTRVHFGSRLDRVAPIASRDGPMAAAIGQAGFNVLARTTMSEFGALPPPRRWHMGSRATPGRSTIRPAAHRAGRRPPSPPASCRWRMRRTAPGLSAFRRAIAA